MLNIVIGSIFLIGLVWLFAKLMAKPSKPAKPVQVRTFVSDSDFYAVSREFR